MSHVEIFEQLILEGFELDVALGVIQVFTINLTKPIKIKHMYSADLYTKEVIAKAEKLLYTYSTDKMYLVIQLWHCIADYSTRKSLDGLGGCTATTFTELLKERTNAIHK